MDVELNNQELGWVLTGLQIIRNTASNDSSDYEQINKLILRLVELRDSE